MISSVSRGEGEVCAQGVIFVFRSAAVMVCVRVSYFVRSPKFVLTFAHIWIATGSVAIRIPTTF
jgi:hypothetical protein